MLAARVFRLLLRGVDPAAILCLTFTKAGAAEMAGRISGRLARVGADASDAALFARSARAGRARRRRRSARRARTLFAKVLDAPGGGLRIQTIHSFCQGLLAAFPVEAGLVPGFRPLEAREEALLAREALAEMLVAAEREGRARPIDAVGALSLRLGEGGAEAFLRACARAPDAMAALPSGIAAVPAPRARPAARAISTTRSRDAAATTRSTATRSRRIARRQPRLGHRDRAAPCRRSPSAGSRADRPSAGRDARAICSASSVTGKGEPRKASAKLRRRRCPTMPSSARGARRALRASCSR